MTESPLPEPTRNQPWGSAETPFIEMGGAEVVRAVVENFYDIVERESPVLHAMLPADTSDTRQKLYEFLTGWTGGPPLYWEKHGHPRLRLRHVPFPIDETAANEWSRCMRQAIGSVDMPAEVAEFLAVQLSKAAMSLLNR